jgi:hypothetical protein
MVQSLSGLSIFVLPGSVKPGTPRVMEERPAEFIARARGEATS